MTFGDDQFVLELNNLLDRFWGEFMARGFYQRLCDAGWQTVPGNLVGEIAMFNTRHQIGISSLFPMLALRLKRDNDYDEDAGRDVGLIIAFRVGRPTVDPAVPSQCIDAYCVSLQVFGVGYSGPYHPVTCLLDAGPHICQKIEQHAIYLAVYLLRDAIKWLDYYALEFLEKGSVKPPEGFTDVQRN